MKKQLGNNLLKKTVSLAVVASAGILLGLPALAQNDSDMTPRNTAPEVNREQNRPGTGSDGQTRPNLTNETNSNDNQNRMMQNQNYGGTNSNYDNNRLMQTNPNNNTNTNSNSDQNRMMQNRTGTQNQNYRGTNTNYQNTSDTGAVRGLW